MLYSLWCLVGIIAWTSGSESCTESLVDQYQCWDTNGILQSGQSQLCIKSEQRCADEQRCHCPWCDDQWNCPTFEECQANGGFVCSHSLSTETQQAWACIPQEWACDGIWDCPSGEDESREFCDVSYCEGNHNLTYWYQCSDNGRCIDILTVGDGEIDCVNGEDENPGLLLTTTGEPVEMVGQETTTDQPEPETATSTQASSNTQIASTTTKNPFEPSYGIDLLINVLGVGFEEVCIGSPARFDSLERVLASVFALNTFQVTSSCQIDITPPASNHRRLWHSSSSSSSSSDSGEEKEKSSTTVRPYEVQKVLVGLRFDKKGLYMRTLQRMLKHESDSSSDSEEELDINIRGLNDEISLNLSNTLRKLIRVEILRISGNA